MNAADMTIEQFLGKYTEPVTESGCHLWIKSIINTGYGQVNFNGTMRLAHRISYFLANGSIPEDLCVLHKCDVRSCVNPKHLFLGTRDDNLKDAARKGRVASGNRNTMHREPYRASHGEDHYASKLTTQQVLSIRKDDRPNKTIAKEFGVSVWCIDGIRSFRTWKHLLTGE